MVDFKSELAKWGLNETTYEACLKDIDDKVAGNTDCDWSELIEKYGIPMASDSMRKASSSVPFGRVFVEQYKAHKKAMTGAPDEYLDEIRKQQQELRKERQKTRDERTELQRLLREQARRESFIDLVKRAFEESVEPLDYTPSPIIESDNDMIICLSDIHAGIKIDSFFNDYNMDIVKERLRKYLDKITSVQSLHKCKEAHLVLGGDLISGLIHIGLRIESSEHCVDQLKMVSIYIGEFVKALVEVFEKVNIHSVAGNHSRMSPKKEDALKGEMLDALVPFHLGLMFENNKAVSFSENIVDDTIAIFRTRGEQLVYCVHGHLDSRKSVVKDLTLMTGIKPDLILMGHLHHNALDSEHGVKIVSTGSLCGMDNFCIDHRISGRPEQAIIITNEFAAVECMYDIGL